MKQIKISNKWMQHKFMCSPEYISNVCHGQSCCFPPDHEEYLLLPDEILKFKDLVGCKICPHVHENGMCDLEVKGKDKVKRRKSGYYNRWIKQSGGKIDNDILPVSEKL